MGMRLLQVLDLSANRLSAKGTAAFAEVLPALSGRSRTSTCHIAA